MNKKEGNSVSSRYPQRDKKAVDYKEMEEPKDDRWIYCDGCNAEVIDWCRRCGRLSRLLDRPGAPPPGATPSRARQTLPSCLLLRPSPIHGLGVFAATPLPAGVQMGPYGGRLLPRDSPVPEGYAWRLRDGRLVDAADERHANWMRFVNCAPHASRQNLVGFQYRDRLYYRTVERVGVGEELLVYYGDGYARAIGVDVDGYYEPAVEGKEKDNEKNEKEKRKEKEREKGKDKKEIAIEVVAVVEEGGVGSGEGRERRYYACRHCGIGLYNEKFKVAHELKCVIHKRELESKILETFECKFCRCPFISKECWEQHESKWCKMRPIEKKKKSEEIFKCHQCDYVTKRRHNLKTHLFVHNIENTQWFHCDECSYRTTNKSAMTHHKWVHTNTFSCACRMCGKSFRSKQTLDDHLLHKHSDEYEQVSKLISSKIYSCNICNKFKTVRKYDFMRHLTMTHLKGAGLQPNRCPKCEYTTFRKSDLKQHLKVHSGEKQFVCTACNKAFRTKRQFDGHLINNHKNNTDLIKNVTSKVHNCECCSYKTVHTTNLALHFKTHDKN